MSLDGAAAMPVLAALGLMIGRRGHAQFCRPGALRLLRLSLWLAPAGVIYFPLSCYFTLFPYKPGLNWIAAFFSLPGLPWLSAWLAWIAGCALLYAGLAALGHVRILNERLEFAQVKTAFLLTLAAAACFFATWFLNAWPFAGLPAELSLQRVLVAVSRNTFRHWFLALSTGGAIALALAPRYFRQLEATTQERAEALRWCALWAAAGAIPSCLQNLGIMLGLLGRAMPAAGGGPGAQAQIFAIACGALALAGWIFCFWKKRSGLVAWLALVLLALKYCSPWLASFFKLSLAP